MSQRKAKRKINNFGRYPSPPLSLLSFLFLPFSYIIEFIHPTIRCTVYCPFLFRSALSCHLQFQVSQNIKGLLVVTLPSRNRPILLLTACARATLDSREKINTPLFLIFDQIYSDRKRDTHKNTKRIICVTAHSRRKNGSSPRVVASRCNRLNWYCSASDHIFFFFD